MTRLSILVRSATTSLRINGWDCITCLRPKASNCRVKLAARSEAATTCYPTRNLAASAKLYTVDPAQHLRADRDAESRGEQILGVFHSHTHTDAYPSSTDVAQAPDPAWHYVLVSLRDTHPVLRSYRIVDGRIEEEPVLVDGR